MYQPALLLFLVVLVAVIWDTVWRGIALWKAAHNKQLYWFIAILIFNTIGILPIIYIAFFQRPNSTKPPTTT